MFYAELKSYKFEARNPKSGTNTNGINQNFKTCQYPINVA